MLDPATLDDWSPEDCVRVVSGIGWRNTNSRLRGSPSSVCAPNAIGYRASNRVDGKVVVYILGESALFIFPKEEVVDFDPLATGDDVQRRAIHQEKICATCFVVKPLAEFPGNRKNNTITKTRPHCTECYSHNSGKGLTAKKRKEFLTRFGKPDGTVYQCPICERLLIVGVTAQLNVDHDQETGEPRELICASCNTGLGKFEDPDTAKRAFDYLKKHGGITE